jgi:D-3-phosphoglycerate dehydrogenase
MSSPKSASVRVLVSDSISEKGIDLLRATPGIEVTVKTGMKAPELAETIGDFDALIVRSATKVTPEVLEHAGRLQVIGRAGTGVDNIDLPAATRAGVVVMNTPGGNSLAAAEHTISLLTALARNVAQANAELREGRWERKKYMGIELAGKTLGVVGLGRIGREVVRRARGLQMEILGYDPYVSEESVSSLGVTVCTLDRVLAESDFVTLHMPKSEETRNMIDADALAKMKPGARLINCARGGLIDEAALLQSIESGHLGGAGLDVFESEPPEDLALVQHAQVVATPHLGASTVEAQERVGTDIAEKIREFFQSGAMLDAVNFPSIAREAYRDLHPLMDLAERLGSVLGQAVEGKGRRLEVRCFGSFGDHPLKPVAMAAAKGLLTPVVEGAVSYINALDLASQRGVTVDEGRSNETTPYSGLLRLTLETDRERTTVAGTLYSSKLPRLVEVDGVPVESYPKGHLVLIRNKDVPGVIGRVGSILGEAGVNIAGVQLGRNATGDAISILNVDTPVPQGALDEIDGLEHILTVRRVKV